MTGAITTVGAERRPARACQLALFFRGSGSRIVAVGHAFALRGTDSVLELRDELVTQERRSGLPWHWPGFLWFAAILSL